MCLYQVPFIGKKGGESNRTRPETAGEK